MGKPIIPREIRNADWPEWDFLSPKQQEAYSEAIKRFSGNAFKYLNIPREGSTLWKVILLEQEGIARTLPLYQLVDETYASPKDFEVHYVDVPIVALRSPVSPYSKQLFELLKNPNLEHTLIIEGLEIEQDENYPDGLKFKDTDKMKVVPAPDFDFQNNKRRFRSINPDYSINWVEKGENPKGSKILYTKSNDASGLFVCGVLFVYSDYLGFRYSYPYGRVVVKSAEGAAQNFDRYITELQQTRESYFNHLRILRDRINAELPQ